VIAAAKRHILHGYRNQYIPEWDHRCDELYERFNSDHEKESVVRLLEKLNEQRKSKIVRFFRKNELHTLQPHAAKPGT
jgi:hypothetical protein